MQTNGSLRNAVTRGDRECHAKLGDDFCKWDGIKIVFLVNFQGMLYNGNRKGRRATSTSPIRKLIRKTAAHFRLRAAVFLWLIRQNKDNCREEEHENVNQNDQQ